MILGSVVAALPDRSAAIVVLQIDSSAPSSSPAAPSGSTPADQSRILSWPVSGEAAVRTGWGPRRSGRLDRRVHPSLASTWVPGPPADDDRLRHEQPSLTLTAYLALTLNSVQAGANASLYAKGPKIIFVGRFAVEGSAGFDALIHFDPFAFDAKLWLGLNLLLDGDVVCGISGDLGSAAPTGTRSTERSAPPCSGVR